MAKRLQKTCLRVLIGLLAWTAGVGSLFTLHACRTSSGDEIRPAGESFFPLSVGNRWVYARSSPPEGSATDVTLDSIWIDEVRELRGARYYRLRTSWVHFADRRWLRRDEQGDITSTAFPGSAEHTFLRFNAMPGESWFTGLDHCLDSLYMWDDYAVVETEYGRFDGAREIGDISRCADFGWGLVSARGVGPVRWQRVTIAGSSQWLLTDVDVRDDAADYIAEGRTRIVNGH